ncbi:uncharacterized protein NECHADRAFT_88831 [Fusarium vanettenii 77-13-4]|uniref:Uncharacterized protein n=1 Tax=Fusarium vanettenii (strain ATCC MYA-4622 / CBS 123669 / FGSC 9596 / NRRL 45880 / 77-13-4) TaxID=660122 RepID=C7ZN73_FUSV7|nr:uncharacterized protein NECHADRAFT_88831 [Fusarium vanettenii 77-13-4]EEU34536.1 predicted protein [Fusarium vanettenii 77-13-4]
MCFSNTKHVCEGVPVSSLRKGLNIRFEWKCSNAQTQMLRHMALHEVTKQNCTQSTRLSTGGWSSEWPAWTKNWLKMDWTGDTSPPSDVSQGGGIIIDLTDLKETLAEAVPTAEMAMTMNPSPISPPESVDIVMPDACDIPAVFETTGFPMTPQDSPIGGFRPQGMFSDHLPSSSTTSFNQTFFQGHTPSVTSVTSFNPTLASHHGNQGDATPVHYTALNQTLAPNFAQLHSTPTSCTSFNQVFLPREARMTPPTSPPSWQPSWFGIPRTNNEPVHQVHHPMPSIATSSFQQRQGIVSGPSHARSQPGTCCPQSTQHQDQRQAGLVGPSADIIAPDSLAAAYRAAAPSVTSFNQTAIWDIQNGTSSHAPPVAIENIMDGASSYAPTAITQTRKQIPALSQIPEDETVLASRVELWRQNVNSPMVDLVKVKVAMLLQISLRKKLKIRIKTKQAYAICESIQGALMSIHEMRRSRAASISTMARKKIGLGLVKPSSEDIDHLYVKLEEKQSEIAKHGESILKEVMEVGKCTFRSDGRSAVDGIMRL